MHPDVRILPSVTGLFARRALLPTGWADNVLLRWTRTGRLLVVERGADLMRARDEGLALAGGAVLPGRIMLGARSGALTAGAGADRTGVAFESPWPDDAQPADLTVIASAALVDALEAGVTSSCEIHESHGPGDPDSEAAQAGDARWAMGLVQAAVGVGIGLTVLPAWSCAVRRAGAADESRRIRAVARLLGLLAGLKPQCDPLAVRVGLCVLEEFRHARQAQGERTAPAGIDQLLGGLDALDRAAPLHWLGPLGSDPAPELAAALARREWFRSPAGQTAPPSWQQIAAGDGAPYLAELAAAARATGRRVAGFVPGEQGDLVCLDGEGEVDEVWVAGRQMVSAGRHDLHAVAAADRRDLLERLGGGRRR